MDITEADLIEMISGFSSRGTKVIIGVDGLRAVGKSETAKNLHNHFGIRVIKLDDYRKVGGGSYADNICCKPVVEQLVTCETTSIVEGVCLLEVAKRCGINIDVLVYIKLLDQIGRWEGEEVCLCQEPELLKQRNEEIHKHAKTLIESGTQPNIVDNDIIDYHCKYNPVEKADYILTLRMDNFSIQS